ncbi:MAG: hypothetical protein ACXAD7_00340 [Candidatus Kariarchaeaceae archaeon]|jgi:hypothetical protein
MDDINTQIKEIVNRETLAWDAQDVDLLLAYSFVLLCNMKNLVDF